MGVSQIAHITVVKGWGSQAPCKYCVLIQRWLNDGSTSATLPRHSASVGPMCCFRGRFLHCQQFDAFKTCEWLRFCAQEMDT